MTSYRKLYEDVMAKCNHLDVHSNEEKDDSLCDNNNMISDAKETIETVSAKMEQLKVVSLQVQMQTLKLDPLMKQITPMVLKMEELSQLERLLETFQVINKTHKSLELNCDGKEKEFDGKVMTIVSLFQVLLRQYQSLRIKSDSNHSPLHQYFKNVLMHWQKILREKLEKKFVQTLDLIHWPNAKATTTDQLSSSDTNVNADSLNMFILYFTALLNIDIEHVLTSSLTQHHHNPPNFICLPMQIMLIPFKKRFQYHFMEVKSKLNRPEKPEWFLSQILTWIKKNEDFLHQNVDPLLKSHSFSDRLIPSKIQLTCGLLQCVQLKLKSDLPAIVYDDKLFTHTVDEVMLFSRELTNIAPHFDQMLPNCDFLKPFTNEPYSTRILTLEKKKANQFVERILESKTAWQVIGSDNNKDDHLKVPECTDNFVLMLQSVTDRCSFLNEPSQKHAFVKLQLEIIDDFRLRMTQLLKDPHESHHEWPMSKRFFAIMNSVNYLIIVLNEWKNLPLFVDLAEIYSPYETLFEGTIDFLDHMRNELHNQLMNAFMIEMQHKLKPYLDNKWFCLKEMNKGEEMTASESAYEMLYFMATSLDSLENSLADTLFQSLLHEIVYKINTLLVEELVLKKSFNQAGAQQLRYDITNCLMSVFRVYMRKPEAHFKTIRQTCQLLNLQRGTALLLEESLKNENSSLAALRELEIDIISVELALRILARRIPM